MNPNTSEDGFAVEPYPRMRQLVTDAGWMARRKHMIHFDHDIIDDAPAARFANRFKTLVESAYGLDNLA